MKALITSILLVFASSLLHSQGFDIRKTSSWQDTRFAANPDAFSEYTYSSIDIAIVNEKALLDLRFNKPPKPDDPRSVRNRWEREAKDRMRYFGISISFPTNQDSPWSKDLYLPLYFVDTEQTEHTAIQFKRVSTVLDNIPRNNERYRKLNAELKLEKKSVNTLQAFIAQVSDLTVGFLSDPTAVVSTPALITKLGPALDFFKKQLGTGNKEYSYTYGLEILPFGSWKQGVVKQVDVYTLIPAGANAQIPAHSGDLKTIKDADEAISTLQNTGSVFPQILVIHRVSNYNFVDYNLAVSQEVIAKEELNLNNLHEKKFISDAEETQLRRLLEIKKLIATLLNDQATYFKKVESNLSYCGDLISVVGDYYNCVDKIRAMKTDFVNSELFKNFNSSTCNSLNGIVDSRLGTSVGGRTLAGVKNYVESLMLGENNIKGGSLDLLYQRRTNLKYLESQELLGKADYNDITTSTHFKSGARYIDLINQELYDRKYKANVEQLNSGKLEDNKALRDKLNNDILAEVSDFCVTKVNDAIAAYDAKVVAAQDQNKRNLAQAKQMVQDLKQAAITLTTQESCISDHLADPNNNIATAILELYKNYLADFSEAKKEYINQLTVQPGNQARPADVDSFIRTTNDLKDKVDDSSAILKQRPSLQGCFSAK